MNTAICLLCVKPHLDQLDFYRGFRKFGYDIFALADSDALSTPSHVDIDILRVEDRHCIAKGYHHFNTFIKSKPLCSAWDKALYFFADIHKKYDFVWLIEEDVFIPDHSTLINIDSLYSEIDLIVSGGQLYTNRQDMEASKWPHWPKIPKLLDRPPYVTAMCCATRMSRAALLAIKDFTRQYHNSFSSSIDWSNIENVRVELGLPFLEIAFPAIVLHKGLSLARPKVMADTIRGSYESLKQQIGVTSNDSILRAGLFKLDNMYHPIKQLELHRTIRESLIGNN